MPKYDVDAIRQRLKQSQAGKFTDPDQFKPDKAKSATEAIKYRFFILPPLLKGDELKSGPVKKSMEQFFIAHANHWINDRPYPCPRVWDGDDTCKICEFGFDLLRDEANQKNEDKRRKIVKQWMPTTYYAVNIFFTGWKGNPEELRNKVKWFNAPKTCFDHWTSAIMKDDMGDPEDPEAFGIFYNESAAFVYELAVLKQGRQNSYKTSKFLPNAGKTVPMIKDKEGKPHKEGIPKLLRLRHNLWTKIETPDLAKIDKVFAILTVGDDSADDGGFDKDETSQKASSNGSAESSKPKETTKKSTDDDDRDALDSVTESTSSDDDVLAGEMPIDDDDASETTKEPAKEMATAGGGGDDVDSSEIDDLLSQLDDDD